MTRAPEPAPSGTRVPSLRPGPRRGGRLSTILTLGAFSLGACVTAGVSLTVSASGMAPAHRAPHDAAAARIAVVAPTVTAPAVHDAQPSGAAAAASSTEATMAPDDEGIPYHHEPPPVAPPGDGG